MIWTHTTAYTDQEYLHKQGQSNGKIMFELASSFLQLIHALCAQLVRVHTGASSGEIKPRGKSIKALGGKVKSCIPSEEVS